VIRCLEEDASGMERDRPIIVKRLARHGRTDLQGSEWDIYPIIRSYCCWRMLLDTWQST